VESEPLVDEPELVEADEELEESDLALSLPDELDESDFESLPFDDDDAVVLDEVDDFPERLSFL
jgi:hypothetical protein